MERGRILQISKLLKEWGVSAIPLFEIEERLQVKRKEFLHILSLLQQLGALQYKIIPWNPEEENRLVQVARSVGLGVTRSKREEQYHINEQGVSIRFKKKVLDDLLKHPEKISSSLLAEEQYCSAPTFDEKRSVIIFEDKKCEIPISTHQFYFCKVLFSKPLGSFVEEQDISVAIDRFKEEGKTARRAYDAMRAVNKRVHECFGIKTLFERQRNRFRVRNELFR